MNDKIRKLIDCYINNSNELNTDLCIQKSDYYRRQLNILNENEPNKIFKKSHKKWEEEKQIITNKLDDSYNELIDSYKDIEKQILE